MGTVKYHGDIVPPPLTSNGKPFHDLDKAQYCAYIIPMRFVWNQEKNRTNYAKHGVSFEVACKVFDDPLVTFLFDRVVDEEG